jgi:PAS domain S-box-containing protein
MVVEKESENPTACGAPWGVPAMMEPGGALPDTDGIFKKLTETTASAIMIYQEERWIYANPAAERMTGYASDELKDMKFWDICHAADREFIKKRGEARKRGESLDSRFELRFIRKNGEERWVDVTGDVIMLRGQRSGIVTAFDITERKRMESQLLQAQKMEAIGTLAGGIAHDFNNLLMGIQGYTSLMLLMTDGDSPFHDKLKAIQEQVQKGANLTRQLLGFARGGAYDVKPTNMNKFLDKSADLFGRTRKEIFICKKYENSIWKVNIDRGRFDQVFLNLFINAWQAMPGGGEICLETKNMHIQENDTKPLGMKAGRYVRISVADNGMGMDEKTRQRIFDPFFTTKELGQGTGLGLTSAYGIIRNSGGFIEVHSEKGQGSTFNIFLPTSDRSSVETKETFADELEMGHETILVVDDEISNIEVMKNILETLGYRVMAAGSGQEAVAVYREKRGQIDLVILDLIMPGMGGGKAFDMLRGINPRLKILLASGYSVDGEAREILNRGCDGFIQKPFKISILSNMIRKMLAGESKS